MRAQYCTEFTLLKVTREFVDGSPMVADATWKNAWIANSIAAQAMALAALNKHILFPRLGSASCLRIPDFSTKESFEVLVYQSGAGQLPSID